MKMIKCGSVTSVSLSVILILLAITLQSVHALNLQNHQRINNVDEEIETVNQNFPDDIEVVMSEETSNPCRRPCDGQPMTCNYEFVIEYYSTMGKACFGCPYNLTHCSLPNCITGDGVQRPILVVNRKLPGPSVEVCLGDTVEVNVKNRMLDISTTIHWHGILQKKTPFMDGVPFVSQCLINPQSDFLYRFYADNPGTHVWHSHSAVQRGDGMFGPIIVRVPESEDPHSNLYDYDLSEHTISLIDWDHELSATKFTTHYVAHGDNKPPSILVNGKGRFKQFKSGEEVIYTPAEKFTVESGFRYRFRILNAGFLNCPIEFSIDNHNFTVIASDGNNLEPVVAETLIFAAGERYDIVLEANQEVANYWMRFKGILDGKVKKAFQVAILHYKGADEEAEPELEVTWENSDKEGLKVNAVNTPAGTENNLLISDLRALPEEVEDPALKPEADIKLYVPYDFYPVDNYHYIDPPHFGKKKHRSFTPQINHISMQFPNFPVMAQPERARSLELCNGTSISMECRFEFCECPHVLQVPLNSVVEFILIDEGVPFNANHPMHLHGYNFRVIGVDRLGEKTTEEEVRNLDSEGLLKRNFENPPKKDTVTIPDGGYAILRFYANNPGYWILHCHLDFHVELGMALLFKVGDESSFVQPPPDLPTCGDAFNPTPVNASVFARFYPTKFQSKTGISSANSLLQNHSFVMLMFCFVSLYIHF